MLTDWVLIGRLAKELDGHLRHARVVDSGLLEDGRVGVRLRANGQLRVLAFDLFGSPPLITVAEGGVELEAAAGFARMLGSSLRGMRLERVTSRRGDRLVRLTFNARSRFGVEAALELYCELVPRFGNLVLVKGDRIVAAYREFSPANNPQRAVVAGHPYALPPLPAKIRTLGAEELSADDTALFVYRENGLLLQPYVAPLEGFESATLSREPSLAALFAEARSERAAQKERGEHGRRREAGRKRLDRREQRLRGELDALAQARTAATARDELRREGERIFGCLHELDATEREPAKERAAKLFVRYKKLSKSLPHLEARERAIAAALEAIEMLRWEVERSDELGDVESAIAALERPRRESAAPKPTPRRRSRLELQTTRGSRILVGRSPLENVELTFRIARGFDLWFHARSVPGAHVILARDGRDEAAIEDIEAAASLAAYYSKARGSGLVEVDYTLRKHVRRQRNAAPGLVWYERAQTVLVKPEKLA